MSNLAAAQEKCLKPGRIDPLKKQLETAESDTVNQTLKDEILRAGTELGDATRKQTLRERDDKPDPKLLAAVAKVKTMVCGHLNDGNWPTVAAVGRDGTNAFMYLVSRALPIEMQLELYPVVAEALRLNQLDRGQFLASYVDRIQLATGNKQLFGSQAYIRNGFLVLAPIDRPSRVDERRKEFKMEPLRSYERFLEATYQMPLVRAVTEPENPETAKANGAAAERANVNVPITSGENTEEVIKVATALVTLDVVVAESTAAPAPPLDKVDFRVLENGRPVEIESFSRADSPFDIVLLLDMSGSTSLQKGLIRKSTSRFVEMKRPVDRVAVVSFNDTQTVVSDLEADKSKLLQRLKDIEGGGGSFVWDSIKFAQDLLDKNGEKGRRKAIVVMSDGVDNALLFDGRFGSRLSFADLVESVQHGNAAIFPVFLDTSSSNDGFYTRRIYSDARRTLEYLADQSAGRMYSAKNLEDLSAIYDRVLKDVGTVYSIGFSPSDEITDIKWRRLKVEIPNRPGLKAWHRPGYFPRRASPSQ